MKIEISSTEAVRTFGDCLARIRHRGDCFVITKNNKPVAELKPVPGRYFGTLRELKAALEEYPVDPDFARDLEAANSRELPEEKLWD